MDIGNKLVYFRWNIGIVQVGVADFSDGFFGITILEEGLVPANSAVAYSSSKKRVSFVPCAIHTSG